MIRVLHVVRSLEAGGIGTFIMNVYRNIDKDRFQFDFAVTHAGMGIFGNEILELGGNIYFIGGEDNCNSKNGFGLIKEIYKLCKRNKYDVVHCHFYYANAYFLMAAKLAGVKKRISHCHNAFVEKESILKRTFYQVSKMLLFSVGTDFVGCSNSAARYLYGDRAIGRGKVDVIYNGVDYRFWDINSVNIEELKVKYGIQKYDNVICFIGRMAKQKNPLYAIDVIRCIEQAEKTVFIMVGQGPLLNDVKSYIKENELKNIMLLPANSNIKEIQAISDIMLAPSLWEGLSIAFIEAQKMETIVLTSTNVSKEVDMGYCEFLDLDNKEKWSRRIDELLHAKTGKRELLFNERVNEFDIENTCKKVCRIYLRNS